jgi:hypothetical protein
MIWLYKLVPFGRNRVFQKAGNFLTSRVTLQDAGARCSSVIQKIAWILLQCMRLHYAARKGGGGRGLCFRFCVQHKLFCVCGSAFFAALHIKINQYSHGTYISCSALTIDADHPKCWQQITNLNGSIFGVCVPYLPSQFGITRREGAQIYFWIRIG